MHHSHIEAIVSTRVSREQKSTRKRIGYPVLKRQQFPHHRTHFGKALAFQHRARALLPPVFPIQITLPTKGTARASLQTNKAILPPHLERTHIRAGSSLQRPRSRTPTIPFFQLLLFPCPDQASPPPLSLLPRPPGSSLQLLPHRAAPHLLAAALLVGGEADERGEGHADDDDVPC